LDLVASALNRHRQASFTAIQFDRGGHFAATEVSELLVGDIRAFFRDLR
jgi:hypothetical protein